jgi:hypothetical protein
MLNRRQRGEAAQLAADRRRREDEAPRLQAEVPRLASLGLEIDEGRPGSAFGRATYIRRIVVERAPALFVVPCGGTDCGGGAHDLTHVVMSALRQGVTRFDGENRCDHCACVLRLVGRAIYR